MPKMEKIKGALERLPAAFWPIFLFLVLSILVHGHREAWNAFAFQAEGPGRLNEYQTIWLVRFFQVLNEHDFSKTFYLINPWMHNGAGFVAYTSVPPLLTALMSGALKLFAENAFVARSLAIGIFCFELYVFLLLLRKSLSRTFASVALIFWLAQPVVQEFSVGIFYETAAAIFLLGAFIKSEERRYPLSAFFFFLAVFSHWPALLWLPFYILSWSSGGRGIFFKQGMVTSFALMIPVTYYFFLRGPLVHANVVVVEQFPSYIPLGGTAGSLTTVMDRFSMYFHSSLRALLSWEQMLNVLQQVERAYLWSAIPLLALGVMALVKNFYRLPAWVWASLVVGCLYPLLFVPAFLVHRYMALWMSFGVVFVSSLGFRYAYHHLRWRKALALFLLLFLGEATARVSLPHRTKAQAVLMNEVRMSAEKIREEMGMNQTYFVLKSYSNWEPYPFMVYFPNQISVMSPAADIRLSRKCKLDFTVVLKPSLTDFEKEWLKRHKSCSQVLKDTAQMTLLPGACACESGGII